MKKRVFYVFESVYDIPLFAYEAFDARHPMMLFIAFHLLVLGLLIISKWRFWAKKSSGASLGVDLLIWTAFFLVSILSLWSYIGHADLLIYFALPFIALIKFLDLRLLGFYAFLILIFFAFFFLPFWLSRKKNGRDRRLIRNYYLWHFFLYFSLLPGIMLAFAQVSFYGQESPGIRDAWIWELLLYFPLFWGLGVLDAFLSARFFWRGIGNARR
jgi:hypothetical protein